MPRKKDELSLSDLSSLLGQGLNHAITRPSIFAYIPHDKQVKFHSSMKRGRLYIGGNRSGKTVGGVVEDIWRLRGSHPYIPVPPAPIRGRVVTTSYNEGVKLIMIPEFAKWIPPSDLINGSWEDSYAKQERILTLSNGSTCEFMSYDQKLEKFAGTSRHFVHFDEEPPKAIWDECKMRLIDTKGHWYITMTPVEGMTWIYDEVYMKAKTDPNGNIAIISIDTAENPYLSQAEVEEVFSDLDDNEKKARKAGEFVQIGGLVFTEFSESNVIKSLTEMQLLKISSWTHYASMDHGLNNPTAWLWHAVSPSGLVVTYDELYDNGKLVKYYAEQIRERNKGHQRRAPYLYVGDPAITQRNAQTGDSIQLAYYKEGVPIVLGNNDVKIGVDKMNSYLKEGKWLITENCGNLRRELGRVRWKTFETAKKRHDNNPREEIHKKNDHAPDSARYFFSMMPDLSMPEIDNSIPEQHSKSELLREILGAVTVPAGPIVIDENLLKGSNNNTEWSHVDEHMGGMW